MSTTLKELDIVFVTMWNIEGDPTHDFMFGNDLSEDDIIEFMNRKHYFISIEIER